MKLIVASIVGALLGVSASAAFACQFDTRPAFDSKIWPEGDDIPVDASIIVRSPNAEIVVTQDGAPVGVERLDRYPLTIVKPVVELSPQTTYEVSVDFAGSDVEQKVSFTTGTRRYREIARKDAPSVRFERVVYERLRSNGGTLCGTTFVGEEQHVHAVIEVSGLDGDAASVALAFGPEPAVSPFVIGTFDLGVIEEGEACVELSFRDPVSETTSEPETVCGPISSGMTKVKGRSFVGCASATPDLFAAMAAVAIVVFSRRRARPAGSQASRETSSFP